MAIVTPYHLEYFPECWSRILQTQWKIIRPIDHLDSLKQQWIPQRLSTHTDTPSLAIFRLMGKAQQTQAAAKDKSKSNNIDRLHEYTANEDKHDIKVSMLLLNHNYQ